MEMLVMKQPRFLKVILMPDAYSLKRGTISLTRLLPWKATMHEFKSQVEEVLQTDRSTEPMIFPTFITVESSEDSSDEVEKEHY